MLVAEHQVAGRGRLDRVWTSPPRAGLTVSFLLRPDVPAARRGWLPLLTGVALAESVGEVDRRPRLAEVAQRPARRRRPQARRHPRRERRDGGRRRRRAQRLHHRRRAARHRDVAGAWCSARRSTAAPVLLAFLRAFERRYRRWTEALGDPVSSGLAAGLPGAGRSTVGTDGRGRPCPTARPSTGSAEAVDWDGRLVVAHRRRARRARLRRRAARAPGVTAGARGAERLPGP